MYVSVSVSVCVVHVRGCVRGCVHSCVKFAALALDAIARKEAQVVIADDVSAHVGVRAWALLSDFPHGLASFSL